MVKLVQNHYFIIDLLAERGVLVSYKAIRQWCYKFGPSFAAVRGGWAIRGFSTRCLSASVANVTTFGAPYLWF